MLRADSPRYEWRNLAFSLTVLLVIVADQLSKIGIRSYLATGESLPKTGLVRLTHVHNSGAAFGLFQDQSFPLSVLAFMAVAVLLLFLLLFSRRFTFLDNRLGRLALSLILGGTIGNLIDRLRLGYVTDFIDIGAWPSFNIADSAITVGIILFAFSLLLLTRVKKTGLSA